MNAITESNTDALEYPLELRDYWAMVVRRKWTFILPLLAVVGTATALAFLLPATYRSEATLLIQRQSIPQNVVATTVTGYVQEQIQGIRQQLVSQRNLVDLAEKHALFPELLQTDRQAVIERLREDIEVAMVDVAASDPNQAGQRLATIAFTVAFTASTPELAQAVTADLTQRYQEMHEQARDLRAAEVTKFLDLEAQRLAVEIDALEKELAGFKQGELRNLPELMGMNLNLYERTEQEIQGARERIRNLEDQINITKAELSLTQPYEAVRAEDGTMVLSAADRLSALTAQYLQATSRYSAEHPDVIRLSREIRVLSQQAGTGARADELMTELVNLQERLRQAQQKYSPDHPEVISLERSIAALQRGFQTALISPDNSGRDAAPPTNPRYVALQTQLGTYDSSLAAERERLSDLNEKLAEYEERLYQTPVVERDFKLLTRDYENALQKYRELRNKELEAGLAQQLESGESGEKFVVASYAFLPSSPDSPNRLGILLLGGLLGLAAGVGFVAIAEYTDTRVRSPIMLARVLGAYPLAIVPQMKPR